jgi:hypothetical protein
MLMQGWLWSFACQSPIDGLPPEVRQALAVMEFPAESALCQEISDEAATRLSQMCLAEWWERPFSPSNKTGGLATLLRQDWTGPRDLWEQILPLIDRLEAGESIENPVEVARAYLAVAKHLASVEGA